MNIEYLESSYRAFHGGEDSSKSNIFSGKLQSVAGKIIDHNQLNPIVQAKSLLGEEG